MENLDYKSQFGRIKNDVVGAFSKALDIQAKATDRRIVVRDVWVDDNMDSSDWESQKQAVRKDQTWGVPVYASLDLVDRKSGKVLSSSKKLKVATLPKSTDFGSFIVNGKHYQVHNQLRRKPGIYIAQKKNRQLKAEVNVAGRPFDIEQNPETSVFSLIRPGSQTPIPLYPVLSKLGISDSAMAKAWGNDVLDVNKAAAKGKKAQQAVLRTAKHFTRSEYDSADDAAKAMLEYFDETELRPEVTKRTVGREFKKVSPMAILAGSEELQKANSGERGIDDRQALEYKKAISLGDLMKERMFQPNGELAGNLSEFRKKIYRRLNNKRNPPTQISRLVSANEFTPVFTTFFTQSSLSVSNDQSQTNPLTMLNGVSKVTIMGEGGVSDEQLVRDEERTVHPSHMGFIDPIHTPDSGKIGVVTALPLGVQKSGEDLKTRIIDVKKKRLRWASPSEIRDMVLAFPDQFKDGQFVDKKVRAIVNGEFQMVDAGKVDAVISTPKQAFSASSNTIPFLPSSQGVRAQMATKMLEQAIPLKHREAPLVQVRLGKSSIENDIGEGYSIRALEDGVVERVTPTRITIATADGKIEQPIPSNLPLNGKSFLDGTPKVEVGQKVKRGDLLADTNFTADGTLAIGTNLRTAYIPYKGYNFEDGIVVTESGARKLTSEHMHEFGSSAEEGMEFSRDKFVATKPNILTLEQQDKLDKNGIIRKGQILKKGDPIFVGVKENRHDPEYIAMKKLAPSLKPFRGHMEEWTKDVDGEVVDVVRTGKKVKVFVRTAEPAQIGDKVVNRYGGKGIITKILPDGEAPHDAQGRPVDIMLNPHGVVSRMNPSQILETAAAKVAEKSGAPIAIDNFSGENYADSVNQALARAGIKDTETLFDPHSKEPLGEVLVGPQYILKLNKQATSQFSARSEGKYDVNQAPMRGGDDGSKSLDLLTFYSMLSHGARANLREMSTYKATKNPQFWHWLQAGAKSGLVKPPPEPTMAYRKFEAYLKSAGVDVQRNGSKMVLGPITDGEVNKLSNGEVKEPIFVRAKDLREEKGGLMDPLIFGPEKDRWGHMELAEPIPNPVFEKPIKTLTGLKDPQFKGLLKGTLFVDPQTNEFTEEGGLTGGAAVKHLLGQIDVDKKIAEQTEAAKQATTSAKLDEANKQLGYLRALKKTGLKPEEAYIQSKIPVMPSQFRPVVEMPDGTLSNPGLNTLYRDVGLVNNELKWASGVPYIPDETKAELRENLYQGVKALAGLSSPIAFYPEKRRPKGVVEQIKGNRAKEGFYQHHVLKRRQNLIGRGTIIPEPKLGVDEVGLPEDMSWKLFEKFTVRRLVNSAGRTPFDAVNEVQERTPAARAALEAEMAERPVMLNRAPSLHKFSIMAFKPKIVSGKAVKIPPLVVQGFNADFDGDAMNVHVPILPDAVREAEKMLPSNNLYKPGTGQIMIQPQNEAALGLYMLSSTPEGQEKIRELLPEKTKKEFGGKVLDKQNLGALMKNLAEEMPRDHGKVVDKLKALGDEHTYRTGFTIGMKDLLPDIPERDIIAGQAQKAVSKINFQKPGGRETASEILLNANKELEQVMLKRLDQQENNFHLMVRSGARGNVKQLKQVVSTPFVVSDHKGDPIPAPITKSFSEGLPFSDYWNTLYGARSVAVDKQLQTSSPGAFNKDIMATAITNVISDSDCGTKKGLDIGLNNRDVEDRFLANDIKSGGTTIARAGEQVTAGLLNTLRERKVKSVSVRSPLTCNKPQGTCAKCYGLNEDGQLPAIGDNVGATAGQALSEPLTQMTLRTFHSGGAIGSRGVITGYEKIDKLFKMPEIKSGRATLAQVDGKVEKIKPAPGKTGKNVWIGGEKHFVPQDLWDNSKVRLGSEIHKGDIISDGLVQPDELRKLKGMLAAQEYISDQVQDAYKSQGVDLKRREIETVVRSVGNTTKVVDPGDSAFIPGDIAPWTVVEDYNRQSLGKKPLDEAEGFALQEDVSGIKKGSVIDARVRNALKKMGKVEVEVGPRPIAHEPFLKGIERIPSLRKDWMSQMGYRYLKDAIVEGATKGMESDIHGYAPVPAFAFGAEFGDAPGGKSKKEGVY